MRLLQLTTIEDPTLLCAEPLLEMRVDLEERAESGTPLASLIGNMALELSFRAGIGVTFAQTRRRDGHYQILTRFRNEDGMKACLLVAFEMVEALVKGEEYPLAPALSEIRARVKETAEVPAQKREKLGRQRCLGFEARWRIRGIRPTPFPSRAGRRSDRGPAAPTGRV